MTTTAVGAAQRSAGELTFPELTLRQLGAALGLYGLVLTALALVLTPQQAHAVFSEQGPFELLSVPLWVMLAAWCFDLARPIPRGQGVCGLLAVFAAAREADWHKAFTVDSIFKSNYYFDTPAPLAEKLPAAIVAACAFALIIHALVLGLRFLRQRQAWQQAWMGTVVLGVAGLVGVKVLDRMISLAQDWFGFHIAGLAGRLIGAWEEGFEMALPIVFGLALMQYRRMRDAPARPSP